MFARMGGWTCGAHGGHRRRVYTECGGGVWGWREGEERAAQRRTRGVRHAAVCDVQTNKVGEDIKAQWTVTAAAVKGA